MVLSQFESSEDQKRLREKKKLEKKPEKKVEKDVEKNTVRKSLLHLNQHVIRSEGVVPSPCPSPPITVSLAPLTI